MEPDLETQRIMELKGRIFNRLTSEVLKIFMDWEPEDINYISFNRATNSLVVPSALLDLVETGLIEQYGTCCDDIWYGLSDDGKKLQQAIGSNTS